LTLLDDIQYMNPEQIASIANSEAYFGLAETTDVEERTELLEQELAMSADVFESEPTQAPLPSIPDRNVTGRISPDDGHEYLEHPTGSGVWFYRNQTTKEWDKWE